MEKVLHPTCLTRSAQCDGSPLLTSRLSRSWSCERSSRHITPALSISETSSKCALTWKWSFFLLSQWKLCEMKETARPLQPAGTEVTELLWHTIHSSWASHPLTCSPSHPPISQSHPFLVSPSHPFISPSHLTFSPSHPFLISPSHPFISPSHRLTLSPHLLTFSSSHPLLISSFHLTLSLSHPLIPSPSHLLLLSFSHLTLSSPHPLLSFLTSHPLRPDWLQCCKLHWNKAQRNWFSGKDHILVVVFLDVS